MLNAENRKLANLCDGFLFDIEDVASGQITAEYFIEIIDEDLQQILEGLFNIDPMDGEKLEGIAGDIKTFMAKANDSLRKIHIEKDGNLVKGRFLSVAAKFIADKENKILTSAVIGSLNNLCGLNHILLGVLTKNGGKAVSEYFAENKVKAASVPIIDSSNESVEGEVSEVKSCAEDLWQGSIKVKTVTSAPVIATSGKRRRLKLNEEAAKEIVAAPAKRGRPKLNRETPSKKAVLKPVKKAAKEIVAAPAKKKAKSLGGIINNSDIGIKVEPIQPEIQVIAEVPKDRVRPEPKDFICEASTIACLPERRKSKFSKMSKAELEKYIKYELSAHLISLIESNGENGGDRGGVGVDAFGMKVAQIKGFVSDIDKACDDDYGMKSDFVSKCIDDCYNNFNGRFVEFYSCLLVAITGIKCGSYSELKIIRSGKNPELKEKIIELRSNIIYSFLGFVDNNRDKIPKLHGLRVMGAVEKICLSGDVPNKDYCDIFKQLEKYYGHRMMITKEKPPEKVPVQLLNLRPFKRSARRGSVYEK